MKLTSFILSLLLLPILSFSQSSCPNLDFENGDFNGWTGRRGCNPMNPADFEFYIDPAICSRQDAVELGSNILFPQAGVLNNIDQQHAIIETTWNNGEDPYVPNLKLTPPNGGKYVCRIGDNYAGGYVGELTYNLNVDSNNALLTAYYAVVLEDPSGAGQHIDHERPYFRIRLLDPDGNSIECVEYLQDGTVGAEGFNTYNCNGPCTSAIDGNQTDQPVLIWRDWTAISVNLLPYLGQDVTIEFTSGDCALTGHLGYTYIDLKCQRNELLSKTAYICKGVSADLSAPGGMSDYEWHHLDSLGAIVGTTANIMAEDTGMYYCKVTPFSSAINSCPFYLSIYVAPAPSDPTADFEYAPNPACIGQNIQFTDLSTTEDGSPLASWKWDFGDGSANSNLQNPVHAYTASGFYDVSLFIESDGGCRDTLIQQIEILELANPIIDSIEFCSEDLAELLSGSPADGTWSGIGITDTVTGEFDPAIAFASGTSPFIIRYEAGECGEFFELPIPVLEQHDADFPIIGPFCNDDPAVPFAPVEAGGVWTGTGVDATGLFTPANAALGENEIQYTFPTGCPDSLVQKIIVNKRKDATIEPVASVCLDDKPFDLEVEDEDGIWTGNGVDEDGEFDPEVAGVGYHTIIYTLEEPCPDADTIVIRVVDQADATFPEMGPFCETVDSVKITPLEGGGTWSGTYVTSDGVFLPSLAGPGKHTITYYIAGDCGDTHTEKFEVLRQPSAAISGPATLCPKDNPVQIVPTETGGIWSGTAVSATGKFDPAAAPVLQNILITYIIPGLCADTGYHTIFIKDLFDATITPAGPYCDNDNTLDTLSAVDPGGVWAGPGIVDATAGTFNPSLAGDGIHAISYTIPGSCGSTDTTLITVHRRPDATINPVNPQCHDATPFPLTTVESGGTWSGAATTTGDFLPPTLSPGSHRVYYEFNNFCPVKDSLDIIIIAPIVISDSVVNASCKDVCDGEIHVTTTGGWTSAPFTYSWSEDLTGTQNRSYFTGACDGPHRLDIVDFYGCRASTNFVITEPDSLLFQLTTDSSSCAQSNGSAEIINVTGGTTPYTYMWDNGTTTALNANIPAGNHIANVIDFNSCTTIDTATVGDRTGPTFTVSLDSVKCFGGNDGIANMSTINNGTGPYSIQWSTGLNTDSPTHNGLSAGTYQVTATDITGCFLTVSFEILQPTRVDLALPNDTTLCHAQDVTVLAQASGGIPPYGYYWNEVGPQTNKQEVDKPILYDVYSTDDNGCISPTRQIEVTFLPPLWVDALPDDTIICEGESVDLYSLFGGGNGNYQVVWDDNRSTVQRPYTPLGNYGDTIKFGITLSDNCSPNVSDEVTIVFFEPPVPSFTAEPTEGCEPINVFFHNTSTNVASYEWDLGDGTKHQESIDFNHIYTRGTYDIKVDVVSPDGCTASLYEPEYIHSYVNPVADFSWQPEQITLVYDRIQFIDKTLGQPVKWYWEFYDKDTNFVSSSTKESPIIDSPGEIGKFPAYLHVTTEHGCVDSVLKRYEITPEMTVFVPNVFTPNGDGVNDFFQPIMRGIRVDKYRLDIFNRWGDLIWSTTNPDDAWPGSIRENPIETVKQDTYVWRITVRDHIGIKHEFNGHVSVLK